MSSYPAAPDGDYLRSLVEEDLSHLFCPQCDGNSVVLSRAGAHIKASCAADGAYIKFVRQKLPPEERAKWDARKKL